MDLAESTIRGKLSHVESLYKHADETLGIGRLDDALVGCDMDSLGDALESEIDRWQAALHFVHFTMRIVPTVPPVLCL